MDNEMYRDYSLDAKEHLEKIESISLAMNEHPGADEVNELFRAFHTLKGNAAIMGIAEVKEVAHETENMVGDIRAKTIPMARTVTDMMLAAVDIIRRIHISYERQGKNDVDFSRLIAQVRAYRNHARKEAAVAASDARSAVQVTAEAKLVVKTIEDLAILEAPADFSGDHAAGVDEVFRSLLGRGILRFVIDLHQCRALSTANAQAFLSGTSASAMLGGKAAFWGIGKEAAQGFAGISGAADIVNHPSLRGALKALGAV